MDQEKSLFERQFSVFLDMFQQTDEFNAIPEDARQNVINLMVTAAFHVSMSSRVIAIHAMHFDDGTGTLLSEFIADTQESFGGIGIELEDLLEQTEQVRQIYRTPMAMQ